MLIQNSAIHDCGRRGVSLNTYTTHTPDLTISNVTIDGIHFYHGSGRVYDAGARAHVHRSHHQQ